MNMASAALPADDTVEVRALLRQSLETVLARLYSFEQRRAAHDSAAGHSAEAWAAYAELGLTALSLPEAHGGLPGSLADLAMAAEAMGGALALEPFPPTMIAARLLAAAGTPEQQARWLPGIAAGTVKAALADAREVVPGGDAADVFIVSALVEGETALYLIPAAEAGRHGYLCFDWTGAADLAPGIHLPAEARLAGGAAELARALDEATALACADAVGAIRAANRLTLEHARTRRQFGRPIGAFQVLQHRLVDMAIAEELAGPITAAAVAACEGADAKARAKAVSAAKVKVGEAARYVAQQCVQIHGGMGLVQDYPASHYFARLGLFERSHGSQDEHLERFAALD